MATNNVSVLRTGTGWTLDVTACNLLPDLNIQDFIVLVNGSVVSNSNFTKTSQTILTYSGVALASNSTVEVRRNTPTSPYQVITYAKRFSSSDYNSEVDRVYRIMEEARLNGVGPGSVISLAVPVQQAFGVSWQNDTTHPPSRDSLYSDLILRPYNANPTFTGTVTIPTPATADNTTKAATTAYVQANLANYAPLASPTFTGNPTAPTQLATDISTRLATTNFVAAEGNSRLRAVFANGASNQALTNNAFTQLVWTLGYYNPFSEVSSNAYQNPSAGIYRFTANIAFQGVSGRCMGEFYMITGTATYGTGRIFDIVSNQPGVAAGEATGSGSAILALPVSCSVGFRVFVSTTGTPIAVGGSSWMSVEKLG